MDLIKKLKAFKKKLLFEEFSDFL